MANTFDKIATITVTSSTAANIDFQNIPATYTDLFLVASLRTNRSGQVIDGVSVRFNNDTTAGNYSGKRLYGSGSSAVSDTNNLGHIFATASSSTTNIFSNSQVYVPNYLLSVNKAFSAETVNEDNQTANYLAWTSQTWNNTAAITRLTLIPETSSFVQYSSATLYGIKNT